MAKAQTTTQTPELVAAYDVVFQARQAAEHHAWLKTRRAEAWTVFAEHGMPSAKNEAWRNTHLGSALTTAYAGTPEAATNPSAPDASTSPQDLAIHHLEGAAARLVFVDGVYAEVLSDPGKLPAGATVSALTDLAAGPTIGPLADAHLGHVAKADNAATSPYALNLALHQDAAVLHLAKGVRVDAPIHVLFIHTGAVSHGAVHDRLLAVADNGAQLTIVESHVGLADADALTTAVTELVAGENAKLYHLRTQDETMSTIHLGQVASHVGRSADLRTLSFTTGAKICRVDVRTHMAGEGAETNMDGIFLASGDQHVDHHTLIDHAVAHTTSHETYHGVLGGAAHGVFTGNVMVRKDAQRTDSSQSNRNLLISDKALVDTTPQLEIFADDVKCSHGSTIGRLNEDQLFYLRSRGFPERDARRLLTEAFAAAALDGVVDTNLRRMLEAKVIAWFGAQPTPAEAPKRQDA